MHPIGRESPTSKTINSCCRLPLLCILAKERPEAPTARAGATVVAIAATKMLVRQQQQYLL